jgi:MoaA/NifB/PqqE/SkfB family radical SAM enzyme
MCDIWKGNANLQQLTEADIQDLKNAFTRLNTQWVVMSGGEALMNPNLFSLCALLKGEGLKISILSTGLLLKKYALQVVEYLDEVIVSLDGSEPVHNSIRRVPNAFGRLSEGVAAVKELNPDFSITGRCVIQRLNFADWPNIVAAAHEIGLDQISFLAADVSTDAFNRPDPWDEERKSEVALASEQLPVMKQVLKTLTTNFSDDFSTGFIAETPDKLWRIYEYYAAINDQGDFPAVQCNAPWVSAVVEADGTVRPCFFHRPMGNLRDEPFIDLLNKPEEITFRKNLNLAEDPICRKCVCTLNLRPTVKVKY